MEVFDRRNALIGLAGAVLGFVPSHANAQYIMSGKEKAGKKKGPRFVDVLLVPLFSLCCNTTVLSLVFYVLVGAARALCRMYGSRVKLVSQSLLILHLSSACGIQGRQPRSAHRPGTV